ncbi:MAG: hypothetical protein WBP72_18990, partial [Rhodocyclaceae bacterium]
MLALEGDASLIERCRQMLSPDEQQRAGRFVFSRDREQFILAHALLRHVLSRYLGLPAGGIAFESGAAGKPALVCPAVPVSFNLSHSHGRAAIAVSDGRDIGV